MQGRTRPELDELEKDMGFIARCLYGWEMAAGGSYEQDLIAKLKREFDFLRRTGIEVESLQVNGDGSMGVLLILFRYRGRSDQLFGFRFPSWDESLPDPGPWSAVVWTNLEEAIQESDCGRGIDPDPAGVIWLKPINS